MSAKYIIKLSSEERKMLQAMIATGKGAARKLTQARSLLKADASSDGPNWIDEAISERCEVSVSTMRRVRQQDVEESLQAALVRRATRPQRRRGLDGEQEAHLVALVCGSAPTGRAGWSLRLLAERMVRLGYVERVSHETVRQTLHKHERKPWLKEEWCIPPKQHAEFVCHMEDVLDVYTLPYDPDYPSPIRQRSISLPVPPGAPIVIRVAASPCAIRPIGPSSTLQSCNPSP